MKEITNRNISNNYKQRIEYEQQIVNTDITIDKISMTRNWDSTDITKVRYNDEHVMR